MAVEIATAYVNVIPSARGFGRDLSRQLGGAMDEAGASAGDAASNSFGSRLTAGVAAAAKAAGVGLAALGAAAAGWGLKVAADNEQAQISFETLLGSADKAGAFLADLKKFAAETPFEFPELQTAASSLISIGISAEKVIPIMTTLGNVTSGMGTGAEGVKRATVALQQMNAAGRITAEDLNQLRDAGIPVFDLLAAATGKTKEQIAAMAQNAQLGRKELDQLMTALETGKGLERFSGLMEKQSLSLKGVISTLKDTLGQGLADAMAPALGPIKDALRGLSDVLGAELKTWGPVFADAVGTLFSTAAKLLAAVMPLLGSFVALFSSVLKGLAPIIEALTPVIVTFAQVLVDGLNGALDDLLPALGLLLGAFLPLVEPVTRLVVAVGRGLAEGLAAVAVALAPVVTALVDALLPVIGDLSEILPTLLEAVVPLIPAFGDLLGALGPVLKAVLPLLRPLTRLVVLFMDRISVPVLLALVGAITTMATGLASVAESVGKVLAAGLDEVVDWLARLGEDPAGARADLIDFFKRLPGVIGAAIGDLGRWVMDNVITPAGNYIRAHLPAWARTAWAWFTDTGRRIAESIGPLGRWLMDNVITPAGAYIRAHLPEWGRNIVAWFKDMAPKIGAAIGDLGRWLSDNVFTPAATYVSDHLGEWGTKLADFFKGVPETVKGAIETERTLGEWLWENVFAPAADYIATKGPEWKAAIADSVADVPDKIKAGIEADRKLADRLWEDLFKPSADELVKKLPQWRDQVAATFARLPGEIVRAMTGALNLATQIYDNVLLPAARNIATNAPIWARRFIPALVDALRDLLTEELPRFYAIWHALPDQIVAAIGDLGLYLWDHVFVPAKDYLDKQLPALWNAIGRLAWHIFLGIADVLGRFEKSLWDNVFWPAFVDLGNDFTNGVRYLADRFKGLGGEIEGGAKNLFLSVTNAFIDAINAIIRAWNDLPLILHPMAPHIDELAHLASFAKGGRPPPGAASIVGELGPELFVPDRPGTIVPNDVLGAGGGSVNVGHLEVTGQDRPAETAFAIRAELRWLALTAGAA